MNRLVSNLSPTLAGSLKAFSKALTPYPTDQQEQIVEALAAAAHWHSFVRRKSGPLYLAHVMQAATVALLVQADSQTVRASLLHDVLEDTELTGSQLEQRFSKEIRRLVEAVTKHPASSEREFLEKVYTLSQNDIRVGIIKVCDRISNLTHGSRSVFSSEKQRLYLEETDTYYLGLLCQLPDMPTSLTSLLRWVREDAQIRSQSQL